MVTPDFKSRCSLMWCADFQNVEVVVRLAALTASAPLPFPGTQLTNHGSPKAASPP